MSLDGSRRHSRMVAAIPALVPFAFGSLRALQTGTDFRYLITALAAFVAAATIFRLGADRISSQWLLAGLALAGSALLAGAAALLLGASSAGAVVFVTLGFGICMTASGVLGLFARPGQR